MDKSTAGVVKAIEVGIATDVALVHHIRDQAREETGMGNAADEFLVGTGRGGNWE